MDNIFQEQEISDEALADLVKQQDHQAFAALMGRYQDKIYRYIFHWIRDADQAKDLTQDTFLLVYENIHNFDSSLKFSAWLYRIAHNLTVNFIKRSKRIINADHNTLSWLDAIRGNFDDVVAKIERQELTDEVGELCHFLPLKYREVLCLFYQENKSYEEIADILRTPVSTIGVRLRRGRQLLKKLLLNKYAKQQKN